MKSIFKSTAFVFFFVPSRNPMECSRTRIRIHCVKDLQKVGNVIRTIYLWLYRRLYAGDRAQKASPIYAWYVGCGGGQWGYESDELGSISRINRPTVSTHSDLFVLFDGQTERIYADSIQRCGQMFTIWLDEFHLIALLRRQLGPRATQCVKKSRTNDRRFNEPNWNNDSLNKSIHSHAMKAIRFAASFAVIFHFLELPSQIVDFSVSKFSQRSVQMGGNV